MELKNKTRKVCVKDVNELEVGEWITKVTYFHSFINGLISLFFPRLEI